MTDSSAEEDLAVADGTAPSDQDALWRRVFADNPAVILLVNPEDGAILEASESAIAFYGYTRERLLAMRIGDLDLLPADQRRAWMIEAAARSSRVHDVRAPHRLATGEIRTVDVHSGPVPYQGRWVVQSVVHDVTELARTEQEHARLVAAVEHASESIVITDPRARILYVNPAFERVTGYTRQEVLGRNPRILKSGRQPPALYEAMWSTLTAGETWHGELINRRKDGSTYVEEVSITPVFGTDGALTHYVGVKRDVTAARSLEAEVRDARNERAMVAAAVADLSAGRTPEETAHAIALRVLMLPGIEIAGIATFAPRGGLRELSMVSLARHEALAQRGLAAQRVADRRRIAQLRARVEGGPWIEHVGAQLHLPIGPVIEQLGVAAVAVVPVRVEGDVVGFLQAGAGGPDAKARLGAMLPALVEFAAVGSVLLGPQIRDADRLTTQRQRVEEVIGRHAFRPVFQPIVELATGTVTGFEALTRFTDRTPPDAWFAQAARAGMGAVLELATLEAAIEAAHRLPLSQWLNLNVSVGLLDDPAALASTLWRARSRPLVLELTEHDQVRDYNTVRERLAELGLPLRLAIDDAGAGYSSLRHILELRPDLIKLDRSLVAGIDADPVRQALVTGLRHFADGSGAQVIAEGIETAAERDTLLELEVTYGQGYLLGRPAPVARFVRGRR